MKYILAISTLLLAFAAHAVRVGGYAPSIDEKVYSHSEILTDDC